MKASSINDAALLKIAAEESWSDTLKAWTDTAGEKWDTASKYFTEGMDDKWKTPLIGILGGGLIGGGLGAATGRGFWGPALLGAGLGGVGGYFKDDIGSFLGSKKTSPVAEPPPAKVDPAEAAPEADPLKNTKTEGTIK